MSDSVTRRDWLKTMGLVGAGALVAPDGLALVAPLAEPIAGALGDPTAATPAARPVAPVVRHAPGAVLDLVSTSDIFIPPRGRGFQKFSFDFPEPSVAFGDYTFGFLVFTAENTYGLDRAAIKVDGDGDALTLTCERLVWAGGQQTAPGRLTASLRRKGVAIEWDAVVEMELPVKSVTTIVRGVPRGHVSLGAGGFRDPKDDELLAGYAFGAGDLNGPGGSMSTPLLMIQTPTDVFYVSSLDDRMRPKRFYLAPGETSYRVEAVYEHDAWREDRKVSVPTWRLGRVANEQDATALHMQHIEKAFALKSWETRTDVPAWMRNLAMVTTLHGMHYTGYMFNDFAKMLDILRWMATQIPGDRVLVFLPAWDGRYYWDYPTYSVSDRMGGEGGFRRLIDEGHKLGFKLMPMYGTNAANTKLPSWPKIASAITRKIDGNVYNLDWVDWNNDRHGDGWLAYMNLGADAWREHLGERISDMITRYGVDAYFLDIVGGHVNSTNGDMHEGTRRLVEDLRAKHPQVACVGEMPYDALHGFIPMFQVGLGPVWSKYSRAYQHLSSPAAGRGSSGVHESGFGKFNPETLSLSPNSIPTLQVVDDTFTRHRDVMTAIIHHAKQRAGIV
jgi:diadenosine tetraphosphatase ApaH/serine/threonine PP2A family protein phosphatase